MVTEVTVRVLPTPPGARALLIGFLHRRRRGRLRRRGDRRRHHSRRHGDHGPARRSSGRSLCPCRLSARCEGAADRRTRRLRGRSRPSDRRGRDASPRDHGATSCRTSQSEEERLLFWAGRKAAFPGGRPHLARLLLHGRHHPAQADRRGAGAHEADGGAIRPARRQCVSCRRRQSASADPLRRQQARASWSGPRSSATTFCGYASRSAAC